MLKPVLVLAGRLSGSPFALAGFHLPGKASACHLLLRRICHGGSATGFLALLGYFHPLAMQVFLLQCESIGDFWFQRKTQGLRWVSGADAAHAQEGS